MNCRLERTHIDVIRNRALQNDPNHIRVVIHLDKALLAIILGQRGWPALLVEGQANFCRGARLTTDID